MKRKLIYLILIQLFLFSCQNDSLENATPLTANGEQFMEVISTYDKWQTDWNHIKKTGSPLPDEANLICDFPQDNYYIVPIVNDQEITHIALYPLKITDKSKFTATSPVIIDNEVARNNLIIQNMINSQLFNSWKEKGYAIKFEKNENTAVDHTSQSRCYKKDQCHTFCYKIVYSYYNNTAIEVEKYFIFLNYLRLKMDGYLRVRDLYNEPHLNHQSFLAPADKYNFDQAKDQYGMFIQEIGQELKSMAPLIFDVNESQFGFERWKEEGTGGGDSGGNPNPNPNPNPGGNVEIDIQNGADALNAINNTTKTTLSSSELSYLEGVFHNLVNKFPEMKTITNAFYLSQFPISFHIGPVTNNKTAQFKADGSITFQSKNSIYEETLLEELLYALGYIFRRNNLGIQRDFEFEVRVLQDLLYFTHGYYRNLCGISGGEDQYYAHDYEQFILDIANGASFDDTQYYNLFHRWRGCIEVPQIFNVHTVLINAFYLSQRQ